MDRCGQRQIEWELTLSQRATHPHRHREFLQIVQSPSMCESYQHESSVPEAHSIGCTDITFVEI